MVMHCFLGGEGGGGGTDGLPLFSKNAPPITYHCSLECLQWLLEEARGHAYQSAVDGMAPIHAAAQAGQKACLEYLVKEANLSVRCRADDGATPAHFAAASGQVCN